MSSSFSLWRRNGEHWIWLNAAAIALCTVMVGGVVGLIAWHGLAYFWPADIELVTYQNNGKAVAYAGENVGKEAAQQSEAAQTLYKIGSREYYGLDFKWLKNARIQRVEKPLNYATVERLEWGNVYARLHHFEWQGRRYRSDDRALLRAALHEIQELRAQLHDIERTELGTINQRIESLELEVKKYKAQRRWDDRNSEQVALQRQQLNGEYERVNERIDALRSHIGAAGFMLFIRADGSSVNISFSQVVRIYFPNQMTVGQKIALYFSRMWEFVSDHPREANVEGGVFPALFGTVAMVLLMTIFVTPAGVITAIYLREYAHQGVIVRLIRISVNNLAGVPSIVYGVFGLGFFVYVIGGSIDQLFYNHSLPSPVFGAPGLLWASLTLALLTMPVVIVATEEGLTRIPSDIREGSLALGATKFETLTRTILPMTSPAIMTGLIFAVARAAGEVAPLMLVGVVKLAPDLALDSVPPFLHLDRQFMHLGFHIYDVGFQSPNVEAARPLVYATALLLLLIIIVLNLTAISIRNRLREKFKALEV